MSLIAASGHCHQQRFAVNVWVSIVHYFLFGSYLLPSGPVHWFTSTFLEEKPPEFLEKPTFSLKGKHMVPARCDWAHFALPV